MKNKKEQAVENVSAIIAKSCGIQKPTMDPALCKIFASAPPVIPKSSNQFVPKSSPAVPSVNTNHKTTIKRNQISPYPQRTEPKKTTLSHRDAASIRIEAKLKSRIPQHQDDTMDSDIPNGKDLSAKKRKRKSEGQKLAKVEISNVDISDTPPKKLKQTISDEAIDDEDKSGSSNRPDKKSHTELNAPKEKNAELERRTVFIGNVPKDTKKKTLKQLFSEYGEIETIRFRGAAPAKPTLLKKIAFRKNEIHPDSDSIVSYIRYKTRQEAKRAVKHLNGHQLDDHYLTVDLAITKYKQDNKKAVFVGNLSLKIHDDELRLFFAECGPIKNVRVVRDRVTQMGKGFGYVNFKNTDAVELALKLDGKELKNREVRVKRAVKKEKLKGKVKRSQGEKKRMREGNAGSVQKSNSGQRTQNKSVAAASSKPPRGKSELQKHIKKEAFAGDCLSEIGKLKRKAKKPNKGEIKKARIIHKLTGIKPKPGAHNQKKQKRR